MSLLLICLVALYGLVFAAQYDEWSSLDILHPSLLAKLAGLQVGFHLIPFYLCQMESPLAL